MDDAGDTTHIAAPARRIVSLIPSTTEMLFTLGAGDRVVGRTTWCDYPAEALVVPSLGDGLQPSLEGIVATGPDLVLLYRSPQNALTAERLRALGIPTLQLRVDRIADVERALGLLGRATGLEPAASRVIDSVRGAIEAARAPAAVGPGVMMVVWDQPPMVIGAGSFLHEVIELAGGRNVFGDLAAPSPQVSLESIAARRPDLILTTTERPDWAARPEWRGIPAVRDRRFIVLSGSEFARPTPRIGQAVARLRRAMDSVLVP